MNTRNNMILCIAAVIAGMLLSSVLSAQVPVVSGTVKDSKGEPVIGAVVMHEGADNTGTITDVDGTFSLTLSKESKSRNIVVSCLSYKTVTVQVAAGSKINVVLEDDATMLDESVVIGYGSMRRSDLTGSVTSVKIDEIKTSQMNSLDQLINGSAPGVQVIYSGGSPDSGVAIRIRGTSSINGSNEPLYVIDGVIANNPDTMELLDSEDTESVNNLMGINPQDIASIEILKDASATAIYGANGANGVVLITTKQANSEKPHISINVGFDLSSVTKRYDVLSTTEFVEYLQKVLDHGYDTYAKHFLEYYENGLYVPADWQDYAFRIAPRQRYYVNVSGRPHKTSYNFSVGYNNTQGIVQGTGSNLLTSSVTLKRSFWNKLNLTFKTNLSYLSTSNQQSANSTTQTANTSFITSILRTKPFDFKDAVTEEEKAAEEEEMSDAEMRSSPKNWITDAYTNRMEFRIIPSVRLEYKPLQWLTLQTVFGADFRSSERCQWKGISVNRSSDGALGVINYSQNYHWNWDNTVTASGKWGRHNLTGTIGFVMGRSGSSDERIYGNNIKQYKGGIGNINSAEYLTMGYYESYVSDVSLFARTVYNYDERYILTATYRADGSSKFSDNNKFGHFPSFAAAWRINNERWFKVPVISSLKLRAGWGIVGNANVTNYQTYIKYKDVNYANHMNGAGYSKGSVQDSYANRTLKWETANQANVGLDFGMWKGRFAFSFDAYYKTVTDLLQQRDVPYSSGFWTMWMNTGSIVNKGMEFAIQTVPVKTKNVEWTLDANISFNRNTLQSFGFDTKQMEMYNRDGSKRTVSYLLGQSIGTNDYFRGNEANIFIEGQPVGLFYGYLTDGIIQEGETGPGLTADSPNTPGMIKYVDLNGNGYIDPYDRTIIGDCNPAFTYGFNTSVDFYGFTFSMQFQGEAGKQILNTQLNMLNDPCYPRRNNFLREAYYNAWTPENPNNEHVGLFDCYSNKERFLVLDKYVDDASYLRLSNINLSYTFKLPKNVALRKITLGLFGQNLVVFTKYSGWDPNVSTYLNNMRKVGLDSGAYPSARTYGFNLKLNF